MFGALLFKSMYAFGTSYAFCNGQRRDRREGIVMFIASNEVLVCTRHCAQGSPIPVRWKSLSILLSKELKQSEIT